MTGFAYWMKYHLTNLPDIAGGWHLDYITNNTTIDFSKNLNHGTVYGPTILPGLIDKCLSFDGVDDYVDLAAKPAFDLTKLTILVWVNATSFKTDLHNGIVCKRKWAKRCFSLYTWDKWLFASIHVGGVTYPFGGSELPKHSWQHLSLTYDREQALLYRNANLIHTNDTMSGDLDIYTDQPLEIARFDGNINLCWTGLIDHVTIYNRILTPSDIKRHAERTYPS